MRTVKGSTRRGGWRRPARSGWTLWRSPPCSAPDFRTASDFRKRHLTALGGLFTQVLKLCQAAGLVQLGHVALDGTTLKANASKHKAMSDGRMQKTEDELAATVQGWLQKAETLDARADAEVEAGSSRRRIADVGERRAYPSESRRARHR